MPSGNNAEFGICFQNSYGTSLTSSMHWVPLLSEDVKLDKPPIVSKNMTGRYDEGNHYEGPNAISGTIGTEITPTSIGAFLKAMLGNPATVNSDSLYTHTFTPPTAEFDENSALTPFTFHKYLDDGGSASLFYDLNATALEFSISNGELLASTLEVVGGKFSQIANVAASYPTGDGSKNFTWDQASCSIGGTAIDEISQLSIKITEPIESKHTLNGSVYASRNKRTDFRMVEVSGTLTFDNQDEYQQFLSQSERALILNFSSTNEVQSGYPYRIEFHLPRLRYTEFPPAVGGPGEIEVAVSGKGVYDTSSGAAGIVLYNAQAGY